MEIHSGEQFRDLLKEKDEQGNYKDEVLINERLELSGSIVISENFPAKNISLYSIKIKQTHELKFERCQFNTLFIKNVTDGTIEFENTTIDSLVLNGQITRIVINGGKINHLQVVRSNIFILEIDGKHQSGIFKNVNVSSDYVRNLGVKNLEVNELVYSKISKEYRSSEFRNIRVKNVHLLKIRNGNGVQFNFIAPLNHSDSEIKITNSKLENVHFQNCNFEGFKQLIVNKSSLEGFISENNTWFKRIVNEESGKEDIYAYRQLKGTLQKQYDNFGERYFRSKEFNAYLNSLRWHKKFDTWFLLTANKLSNNHGLSWKRGLLFTLVVSFACYIIYLFTLQSYPYRFNFFDPSNTSAAMDYFLGSFSKFFLVTHDFDFMKEANPTGCSYFWDVLNRIFIGYGIYQTIQAFRNYGK